jgi:hypothetical protein
MLYDDMETGGAENVDAVELLGADRRALEHILLVSDRGRAFLAG